MHERTALVTGASRGIGAGIAEALDAAGYRVVISARDMAGLDAVAARLSHDPVCIAADLHEPEAPGALVAAAIARIGRLDVVVNNAGVAWRGPTAQLDADLVDRLLAVNVRSPLLIVAAVVPHMVERGGGVIVNLSSVSGVVGTPKRAAYAATKGAIDAATRSLAIELGPHGIRVNSIAPGVVTTDLWAANRAIPGVVEAVEQQIPLRRWSAPEDIAGVVVFLASDAARYITGETLRVDGGMAATRDLYAGSV